MYSNFFTSEKPLACSLLFRDASKPGGLSRLRRLQGLSRLQMRLQSQTPPPYLKLSAPNQLNLQNLREIKSVKSVTESVPSVGCKKNTDAAEVTLRPQRRKNTHRRCFSFLRNDRKRDARVPTWKVVDYLPRPL